MQALAILLQRQQSSIKHLPVLEKLTNHLMFLIPISGVPFTINMRFCLRNAFNTVAALTRKLNRINRDYQVGILALVLVALISLLILWTWRLFGEKQFLPSASFINNRIKFEHHSQLEVHHMQMALSTSSSQKLHEIMFKQYNVQSSLHEGKPYKKILYWTDYAFISAFPEPFGLGVGRDVYQKAECPVWQCETSLDLSNLSQYDAVLFHYINFHGWDVPTTRLPEQKYIFFEYEPQMFHLSNRGFFVPDMMKDFFNWTVSYRWDADIVHPYGWSRSDLFRFIQVQKNMQN